MLKNVDFAQVEARIVANTQFHAMELLQASKAVIDAHYEMQTEYAFSTSAEKCDCVVHKAHEQLKKIISEITGETA